MMAGKVTAAGRPVIFEVEQQVASARRMAADIPQVVIYNIITQIQSIV